MNRIDQFKSLFNSIQSKPKNVISLGTSISICFSRVRISSAIKLQNQLINLLRDATSKNNKKSPIL